MGKRSQRAAPVNDGSAQLEPEQLCGIFRGDFVQIGLGHAGAHLRFQVGHVRLQPAIAGHPLQDQPELVIAAIREVVEAVRNPSTWAPAP